MIGVSVASSEKQYPSRRKERTRKAAMDCGKYGQREEDMAVERGGDQQHGDRR